MSADSHALEALARIEYKLDALIRFMGVPKSVFVPMNFVGQECPACEQRIDYTIDNQAGVVRRVCRCGTRKVPLEPVQPPRQGEAPSAPRRKDEEGSGQDSQG